MFCIICQGLLFAICAESLLNVQAIKNVCFCLKMTHSNCYCFRNWGHSFIQLVKDARWVFSNLIVENKHLRTIMTVSMATDDTCRKHHKSNLMMMIVWSGHLKLNFCTIVLHLPLDQVKVNLPNFCWEFAK